VLDEGRLDLENNRSEHTLRRITAGCRGWLLVGNDHRSEAGRLLLSLVASAQLHKFDPEAYLRDLLRDLDH